MDATPTPTMVPLLARHASPWERLTPLDRLQVSAGLVLVLVLGTILVLLIRIGARLVRGHASHRRLRSSHIVHREDDWADKPLVRPDDE